MAPVIGELAFFFGIVQPMLVKARPDGDVQLLLLTREDANALFNSYPEQVGSAALACANFIAPSVPIRVDQAVMPTPLLLPSDESVLFAANHHQRQYIAQLWP